MGRKWLGPLLRQWPRKWRGRNACNSASGVELIEYDHILVVCWWEGMGKSRWSQKLMSSKMSGLYDLMNGAAGREYKRGSRIGKRWQIHGNVVFVVTVEQPSGGVQS